MYLRLPETVIFGMLGRNAMFFGPLDRISLKERGRGGFRERS